MDWKSPITRIVMTFLLLGVIGAGVVTWREYERGARIQKEIDMLRAEAEKIQKENQGLNEKIAYFASPNFREQEAKQKLGYKRQNEEVVLVRPEEAIVEQPELKERSQSESQDLEGTVPKYLKWWNLFYKK